MQLFIETILSGLALGLVYSVIALGYTMVYGVLELINFAHSEIFMFGGIVGVEILLGFLTKSTWHPLLQLVFALVVGAAASGILAVTVERVAYRPLRLRGAPRLVPLISAIGMSLFLQDIVRLVESLFGNFNRPFPSYVRGEQPDFFALTNPLVSGATISNTTLTIFVVGALMLAGLTYFVNYTKTGRAIRAVAQDQSTSSLMGINVNSIITVTFLIGGALGGVAGVLYALKFGTLNPYSGFLPGLKAFTAAVLGGIGSIPGAMLGGVVLGLLEQLAAQYISSSYKDIIAFGLLILILIFRPSGLLGRKVSEKV
jgi:branched-chain amino acid transport system permease protein